LKMGGREKRKRKQFVSPSVAKETKSLGRRKSGLTHALKRRKGGGGEDWTHGEEGKKQKLRREKGLLKSNLGEL